MSRKRNNILMVAAVLIFVGILAWSTIQAQAVECEVCVSYNGRENCATTTAASAEEAVQSAQTTACGPLVFGMNDAIACGNIEPTRQVCRR